MDKNALMIAIGKIKPKGMSGAAKEMAPEEPDHEEHDMGKESAFEELAMALGIDPDKIDSKAGSEALQHFLEQCHGEEEAPDEDEEESDHEDSSY